MLSFHDLEGYMFEQADLALFYVPLPKGLGQIGEKWDKSSYIQAVGFVILVAGTLIYGRGDEQEEKQQVSALLSVWRPRG